MNDKTIYAGTRNSIGPATRHGERKGAVKLLAACAVLALGAAFGASAQAQPRYSQVPDGSYRGSCDNIALRDGRGDDQRLMAVCRDRRGEGRQTSISLPCRGDIRNDNGSLVCVGGRYDDRGPGRGPGGFGGPGGSVDGGRITLYSDDDFRGRSVSVDRPSNLIDQGFNDRASSIRVDGPWEVCTDANFRGRCTIIQGPVRSLNDFGMNDQISSVRPAGGRR
ncbi:MAG: hypothetical protein JWQ11_704 [Rhizobacter sp.]|nr:hypothetical protein [Rhizobacter sp.]